MTKNRGRTIQIFLTNGTPSELSIITIHGWTGLVMIARNATLKTLCHRNEANRAGIYILYGNSRCYIGEATNIQERLPNSAEKRDFWELAAVVTTSDESLTKAHIRYLEARLIQIVDETGRVELKNKTKPSTNGHLPEADLANMEAFLQNVLLILPVVGLTNLHQQEIDESHNRKAPKFVISKNNGVNAEMIEVNGEYVIRENSTALKNTGNVNDVYCGLKNDLIHQGKLIIDGDLYKFKEDVSFSSLSAAAAIVLDRNANGWKEWRVEKDRRKTYRQWHKSEIPKA